MRIAIVGAGLVGLFIGSFLKKAGHDVVFIGRQRFQKEIEDFGLTASDLEGKKARFEPKEVSYHVTPDVLSSPFDYVLLTLKAVDLGPAAEMLQKVDQNTPIISFQNGVRCVDVLKEKLPSHKIYKGMFPFNVVELPDCHVHQASFGKIMVEQNKECGILVEAMKKAGLVIEAHPDLKAVLYGKLLFNLNNAVNALSGLSIRQELSNQLYRKALAKCIKEALDVYQKEGIKPFSLSGLPTSLLPYLMMAPNFLFLRFASAILSIEDVAFSSMFEDLKQGRKTEIEFLNGEIVRLGQKHNIPTPGNLALLTLIQKAEKERQGSPQIRPDVLLLKMGEPVPSGAFNNVLILTLLLFFFILLTLLCVALFRSLFGHV